MKVGIVTVQIPFIRGGAEVLAESLQQELRQRKVEAEIISMPFKWYPPERILDCMLMARLMDVEEVNGQPIDRLVVLKFPAYYVQHPCKVGWLLHQHRQAYELFGTDYCDLHDSAAGLRVVAEIRRWDNEFLRELKGPFVISGTVAERLKAYNDIASEPLYPPPGHCESFRCDEFGDFVLYPGRLDPLKRQHLIVDAMQDAPPGLSLVLIGQRDSAYGERLLQRISAQGLDQRVEVLGPVSEELKIDLYARCLAVYNGVFDEDYGYATVEAFLSGKPVITHIDSGGPCEFVEDHENGYVVPPDAESIRICLEELAQDRARARLMGAAGKERIAAMHISWDYAIERLLS